jgi:protein ImuA
MLQTLAPLSAARSAAWIPGLADAGPCHAEVFSSAAEASGAALALAFAQDRLRTAATDPARDTPDERAWLWVQDARAIRLGGRPYRPGLPRSLRHRLVHVAAKSAEDALFALEEGLGCRDLAFVIGELAGNPRALDLTASRRLGLAAEKHGTPLWLVRLGAERDLSSARMRWQAGAAASALPRWNPQAPGAPAWRAELFRARAHPPGEWVLEEQAGRLGVRSPLPFRGEGTQACERSSLAGVGEGTGRPHSPCIWT